MFKDFLSALTLEILQSLRKKDGFNGSKVFKDYLASTSEDDLMKDLRLVFRVINETEISALNLKESDLFKAIFRFFAEEFADQLDALGSSFYLLSYEERKEKARQLIEGDSHSSAALRELLLSNSYQELSEAIEILSKSVGDADTIVVQAPREIEPSLKKEMRKKFAIDFPLSFPSFQVNRQLIGGFRVFVNGKSHDFSWFSQVQKLSSNF